MAIWPFKKDEADAGHVPASSPAVTPAPTVSSSTGAPLTSDARDTEGWRAPLIEGDPRHIAIIMDGNGRWAKRRHIPRKLGHREGVEAVRRTVEAALDRGIPYITLYAFSSENWSRPEDEVEGLMGLLRRFMDEDLVELEARGVRGRFIGARDKLDRDILERLVEAERRTAHLEGITVTIALNYGGRQEIARAAQRLAREVAAGRMKPEQINEDMFGFWLETSDLPDPDLLIRTSGEQRLSNFLPWQTAYTEFYFPDVVWPDYNEGHLLEAIEIYRNRERRYGGREDCAPYKIGTPGAVENSGTGE